MLFDIYGKQIINIPHKASYEAWCRNLSQEHHDGVIDAIHKAIDDEDIFNASFIPGTDWTGTPYQPLYEACSRDEADAAYFYGIMCWLAVQKHPDEWTCYKDKQANIGRGWTYFRKREVKSLSF
jgi:hypothetical protein